MLLTHFFAECRVEVELYELVLLNIIAGPSELIMKECFLFGGLRVF